MHAGPCNHHGCTEQRLRVITIEHRSEISTLRSAVPQPKAPLFPNCIRMPCRSFKLLSALKATGLHLKFPHSLTTLAPRKSLPTAAVVSHLGCGGSRALFGAAAPRGLLGSIAPVRRARCQCGVVPVQYMGRGLPVVASPVWGGNPEIAEVATDGVPACDRGAGGGAAAGGGNRGTGAAERQV